MKPVGRLALLRIRRGKKVEAIELLESVQDKFDNDAAYHSFFGRAYELLGELSAALSEKQQAVRLNPTSPDLRASLAFTLWSLHKIDDAISEAKQGMTLAERQCMAAEQAAVIQSSLAHYYAEKSRPQDRDRASTFISSALTFKRKAQFLHTSGFVREKPSCSTSF